MDHSQPRRTFLRNALACSATLGLGTFARADGPWPSKPIRIVVGFAPGGPTDVLTRHIGRSLAERLQQSVIVDNRPGASGNIGSSEVVRSPADGHTLLIGPTQLQTANPHLLKMSFDPARDLTPLCAFARTDMLLIAKPAFVPSNPTQLVAMARANPRKLSYASAGAGTAPHLVAELMNREAGIEVVHVPYRGVAPAVQDVMAGQCDYTFDPGSSFEYIKAGKVKLLGVASQKRSQFFPDAPTLIESGLSNVALDITFGIWGPRSLPPQIVTRFNEALAKTLREPAVVQGLSQLGAEVVVPDIDVFKKFLATEGVVVKRLITERNIRFD